MASLPKEVPGATGAVGKGQLHITRIRKTGSSSRIRQRRQSSKFSKHLVKRETEQERRCETLVLKDPGEGTREG